MYNAAVNSFSDYLLSKIQEYEQQVGKRISLDKFAEYVGVSRPLISYWLKGTIPSLENVQLLAQKFGPEVYDVLGLPRPNPYLQKINRIFERLSPEHQQRLAEEAEKYETQNNAKDVSATHRRRKTSKS
jgi:transcriptional regulator with XRE-family HTH domain